MKTIRTTTLTAGLAILVAGSLHAATIENFESALGANESTLGDASIRTGGYFTITDANGGNGQLLLTTINAAAGSPDAAAGYTNQSGTTNAAGSASFNGFFGLTPVDGTTQGREGSGFKITNLSLTAGQVLSFDWDFMTQEGVDPGSGNKDFAFFTLSTIAGDTVLTDAFTTPRSGTALGNPFGDESGYLTRLIPILTTGTYTLTIGVVDAGSISTDDAPSGLLIDNIQVNAAVPEPSTLGLIAAGAAGFAAIRRRIRK